MNNFLSSLEYISTCAPLITTGYIIITDTFSTTTAIYYYICIIALLLLDSILASVYERKKKNNEKITIVEFIIAINSIIIIALSIAEFLNIKYNL